MNGALLTRLPWRPLVTFGLLLLAWQVGVWLYAPSSHLLPAPGQVLVRVWTGLVGEGDMLPHLAATLGAAAAGYAIGCSVALGVAVLLTESVWLERAVYPLVLCFQSIPKVSIAPLIFIWAGFGVSSQIILVALICFFPMFTSALNGLKTIDPNLLDLLRAAGAGRVHTLLQVRLPAAAGALFVGLQVASVFALVGCVVMEFINATQGAGFLIVNASNTLDTATSMATMVVLGLLGLVASVGVQALRARVVFWDRHADVVGVVQKGGAL